MRNTILDILITMMNGDILLQLAFDEMRGVIYT
jgi:hypothetical protein